MSVIGKLFPSLPRYGEHFVDTRTLSKINDLDLSPIDFFLNYQNSFLLNIVVASIESYWRALRKES